MQRPELEETIHGYIKSLYNATYEGLLEVHQENGEYKFILGLPSYLSPTTVTMQTDSDDTFLDFVYEELRTRNYIRLEIYKVVKIDEERRT